jgi:hypothetical protein
MRVFYFNLASYTGRMIEKTHRSLNFMAGEAGFEPAVHGVKFRCLTGLGYSPM